MPIYMGATKDENVLLEQLAFKAPFVVSQSNHERPFDGLSVNGLNSIFEVIQG